MRNSSLRKLIMIGCVLLELLPRPTTFTPNFVMGATKMGLSKSFTYDGPTDHESSIKLAFAKLL